MPSSSSCRRRCTWRSSRRRRRSGGRCCWRSRRRRSLDAGQRMLRAVRAAGIPVMVAQTLRYNGVVRRLMDERTRLGPIHAVRIAQHFEPSRPGWIDDPAIAGGGITLHTGVHSFDLARAAHRHGSGPRQLRDDPGRHGAHRGQLQRGAPYARRRHARRRRRLARHGEPLRCHRADRAGGACSSPTTSSTPPSSCTARRVTPLPLPAPIPTVRDVLADFVTALQRGAPMPIPLEEGLRAVAIADACYRAARSGHAEAVVPVIE